jgi:predicted nucleotidyltransferase
VAHLEDEELRQRASRWISTWLSDTGLCVRRAFLFGSVVHDHYPTSDVDVIVLSGPMSEMKAMRVGRKIRTEMRRQFKLRFGHPLHVQLFHATETVRFEEFLSRLGTFQELPIRHA